MNELPPVEDCGVWGPMAAPPICPDPSFDDALTIVLQAGDTLRKCGHCQSPATTIVLQQYDYLEEQGGIFPLLRETCGDCDHDYSYHVPMGYWAAMSAMFVWEQGRTANAAFAIELENRDDLARLDDAKKIPVALQLCVKCNRWLESRDGKAPCICPDPQIIEGPPGHG